MAMSGSQYFEPTAIVGIATVGPEVALPDTSFTMLTDRGVFSSDGLDTGTRLLLLEAPSPAADGQSARPRMWGWPDRA